MIHTEKPTAVKPNGVLSSASDPFSVQDRGKN